MDECVFCSIVGGVAPAFVVREDRQTVAFLARGPAAPGHTLVVPRTHAADIWEVSEEDVAAVARMAKRVAHLLDDRLGLDGLNLVQSNRPAGWQEVFHFHLHGVERREQPRREASPTPRPSQCP